MQHVLTVSTYPGSCFFCIPVFGGKSFLIFLTIDLWSDLQLTCILAYLPILFQFHGQLALKFHWVKTNWQLTYKLHWNYSIVMPKPVYLLTVQEPHREYNSFMDQIRAKYEQLDPDNNGAVGTPAFNAESCELANLLAHVSQLCQKLNWSPSKELYWPTFFKHWRHFLGGLSLHLNHLIA